LIVEKEIQKLREILKRFPIIESLKIGIFSEIKIIVSIKKKLNY